MTIEQLQALFATLSDTQNRLVSMMTALALAIELFNELTPEDHAVLLADWQQQLHALRTLPTGLPGPASHHPRSLRPQRHEAAPP